MKKDVLSRYERNEENSIIIDVAAPRIEDLFNDFDKNAPYIRRDLDPDLVDYLIGCAGELGRESFIIRFTLTQTPDEERLSRIQRSVNNYFQYLAEIERQKIYQMFRRSTILFLIGLIILFVSVTLFRLEGKSISIVNSVFIEGLTVAAWVALWEALAVFIIGWFPHHKNIVLYRRLAHAALTFRQNANIATNHNGNGFV